MSGRVVLAPDPPHGCDPGWTYGEWREATSPEGRVPGVVRRAYPPDAIRFPKGTVWLCDDCGRAWVSLGEVRRGGIAGPGVMGWRPERRRERRRRMRARG